MLSGKAEETACFELILNILGADFLKRNKQLNAFELKNRPTGINLKK